MRYELQFVGEDQERLQAFFDARPDLKADIFMEEAVLRAALGEDYDRNVRQDDGATPWPAMEDRP